MKDIFHPIKIDDPCEEWKKVIISECHEKLVDINELSNNRIICSPVYFNMGIKSSIDKCFVREGVIEKLLKALNFLPLDLKIKILDGWRPYLVQKELYEMHVLVNQHNKFVALPSRDILTPSPHLTGGAVDVILTNNDGIPIDMGSSFDSFSEISKTNYFEKLSDIKELTIDEKVYSLNRRILYNTMSYAGFFNNYNEWWHYDFGNQLWGYYSNQNAIYGVINPGGTE